MKRLILASGSPYRAMQLGQLQIPFQQCPVDCVEQRLEQENPAGMAARLAQRKASLGLQQAHDAVVIGGDQVPELSGQLLRKPGSLGAAEAQLRACSGNTVIFHTGVAVLSTGKRDVTVVETRVKFKCLSEQSIQRYVALDRPTDCAGAFRIERLAPTLLESVCSDDPTALLGLPLLALCSMLEKHGIHVLAEARINPRAAVSPAVDAPPWDPP